MLLLLSSKSRVWAKVFFLEPCFEFGGPGLGWAALGCPLGGLGWTGRAGLGVGGSGGWGLGWGLGWGGGLGGWGLGGWGWTGCAGLGREWGGGRSFATGTRFSEVGCCD